jgi:hypothetical protein
MKSNILKRDYPLSETKMSKEDKKKTSSDTKSNVVKKISAAEARLNEKIKETKKDLLPASSNVPSR